MRVQLAQGAALQDVLARAGRVKRWMAQPIDPELQAQLLEDRRRLAEELLEVLTTWQELGGTIALADASLGEEPTLPSLPRGTPMPADLQAPPPAKGASVVVPARWAERTTITPKPPSPSAIVSLPPSATGDALRGLARHAARA